MKRIKNIKNDENIKMRQEKKRKLNFRSLFQLFKFSKKYIPYLVVALVLAVAGVVFTLIGPGKIGEITDLIGEGIKFGGVNFDAILTVALFLVIIYSLGAIFSYIQGWIMATISARVSKKLRKEIVNKINKVPLRYYDKTTYGNVLSRITNDVEVVGVGLNGSITTLISSIVLFLGALLMMLITNWIMALSAVAATLIGFFLMGLIMSKSQKYFNSQQQTLGKLNGHVEEVYTNHNIIKAYNGTEEVTQRFDEYNKSLYKSAWKSQFLSGLMMPLMHFIGNFGYLVVCVVGVMLAINGFITFGVVVSFMIYIRLFTQPLSQIAQSLTSLQSVSAGSERIFKFLNEEELMDETLKTKVLKLDDVRGDVEFKNVEFGYEEEKPIIKNFSAKIKSGQKVAIVGPTGAGKTTLVNLLMRFYEIDAGEILVDGMNTKEITRENVHSLFSMVLQDTWLTQASVYDNVRYAKADVTNQEIEKACQAVGVEHYIKTLPNGYDTIITEETNISAGQKQLLTIARAMVQKSPMLILDEATSSVDTRTEILIQKAMDKLTENKTSFVIAHRLSTIKNADLILVLKDGDIIEQGNHADLIKKNGFYADLYNSQFED